MQWEVQARLFGEKSGRGASGTVFPSGKLNRPSEERCGVSWKGRVVWWGGVRAAGGGVRCWPCDGNHFRYVQKMGLGQNPLYFYGANFYSVFSCVV